LVRSEGIDFVVAQAENVTEGKGMSPEDMARLQAAGVQAFSGGNHSFTDERLTSFLEDPRQPVVGPANMVDCPGPGYKLVDSPKGIVLVVSILGSIVGKQAEVETENPLKKIDEIIHQCEFHSNRIF
jgi:calcineurin-like phosphoesterase